MGKWSHFQFGFITFILLVLKFQKCLGYNCNSPKTAEDEYNPEYLAKCKHLRPPGVQETIDLLDEGEEKIVLNDAYKNVVFLIGNTGSGKSTAIQWLVGDEDELVATEIVKGSGNLIIEDSHARIGNSTITSQTTFPELIVDSETNSGFYDFSGFRDTRSTSHDIVTTYFIKKVVDHVDTIKIVVTVGFSSVRTGGDRQDFVTLLRHLSEELLNINKYRNSIALVVTKLDNKRKKRKDGSRALVEDDKEINGIANFLTEVKNDFQERLQSLKMNSKDYIFYTKATALIDILLMKDGNVYRNIGIFRRPMFEGPISYEPQLQKGREYLRDIIFKKLKYVSKDKKDFGYTISEESIHEVNYLMEDIHKNILSVIYSIANEINDYYKNVVEQSQRNLKSFDIDSSTVDTDLPVAEVPLEAIIKAKIFISKLTEVASNHETLNLYTQINNTVFSLNVNISVKNVLYIATQSKYLEFLEEVAGKKMGIPQSWVIPFNKIIYYLTKAKREIESDLKHIKDMIDTNIRTDITNEVNNLKSILAEKENTYKNVHNIIEDTNQAYEKLLLIKDINEPRELLRALNIINIFNYNISFSHHVDYNIIKENKHFDFLKSELNGAANYFHNSHKWYVFLKTLFMKLSAYEIQKDKSKCGKLINTITDMNVDIKVTETGLQSFLSQCIGTNDMDTINDLTIDQIKYKALLKTLQVTLEDQIIQDCSDGVDFIITGNLIKFSDINFNKCSISNNQSIEIFASHKVFLDTDLDKTGLNIELVIVAPTLEIIGERKIRLDGAAGKSIVPAKARNGDKYGANGDNGQAGNPGGPGGNFLAVATEIINGWRLMVSANAGNGGAGQHGGDGIRGENGELPTIPEEYSSNLIIERPSTYVVDEWNRRGFSFTREQSMCGVLGACTIYNVFGKKCGNGGNGGAGGHGGLSGNSGIVRIVSKGSVVRVSTLAGNAGSPGRGGTKGDAGVGGGDITVQEFVNPVLVVKWSKTYKLESETHSYCDAGISPSGIGKDIIQPQVPKYLNQYSISSAYKKFYSQISVNFIDQNDIQRLYDHLDSLQL